MVAATNGDVERSDGGGPKQIFVVALRSLSSPAALATRIAASSPAKAIRRATKRLSLPTAVRSKWSRKTNKVHDGIMPEEHHTALERLFLLNGDGNIETGSFNISFTDLLKSPPSNPHSRTYSLTSTSSRKSSHSEICIPLRRFPTIQPGNNPSTPTTSPPDRASSTPSSVKEQDLIIRRPRRLRSYSGLEERKDPLAHFARILSNITHYFSLRNATTTLQRRECLYDLPRECRNECAHWLATHPRDRWDSGEEEEANFSRMFADEYAEVVERNFEETGFWDFLWQEEDGEDRGEDVECEEERAKVVGWVQARQERLFDEVWVTGNGRWGKGEECEKGVGLDGEVV